MRATRRAHRGSAWGILAVLALVGVVGLLVFRNTGPLRGTPVADVLAVALGLISVSIALYAMGYTIRVESSDGTRRLAKLRDRVNKRLIDDPHCYFPGSRNVIPVAFKDAAARDVLVSDPLGDYFTSPGCKARLVILGAAGSGKTVAAIQLMDHLMVDWKEGDPVPVRVPLSTWNTERPLLDWLSGYLKETGLVDSRAVARELLEDRLVLPIFDGLDEMDPPGVPTDKSRALRALERLNSEYDGRTGHARLVLVCRTDRYDALRSEAKVKLKHATVVTLQPLSSDQQLAFLRESGLQDETGQWPPEWQRIADALTWSGTPGDLARVLGTPWRMALLTTAYTEQDERDRSRPLRDPNALLAMDPNVVPHHLLGLYTRAAAATRISRLGGGRYRDSAKVEEWLTVLARHLRDDNRPEGADGSDGADGSGGSAGPPRARDEVVSDTDLVLHRLWRMERSPRMGVVEVTLLSLPFFISLLLAEWLGFLPDLGNPPMVYIAIGGMLLLTQVILPRVQANTARQPVPRRLDWQRVRRWKVALPVAFYTIGVALYVWDLHDRPVLYAAVVVGHVVSFLTAQAVWIVADHPQATLTGPRDPLRAELRYALVWAAVIALWVGAMFAQRMETGLGFVYGPLFAALPAFVIAVKAWRRYVLLKCAAGRRLPAGLGAFLDWCVEAGIMRVEGFAYQFRHRELQEWLAGRP
ncbi:NACHT domain-containing protein [Streptomyces europaeiscabiei]|uniref:NACHT domain-containing protein n=1 Tax=Streptomyces europaeiscabiei TaxID=146819 RepID=A0AAJ2UQP3_9ACTN|nr:NACHT domain-containing protein [Streptomyces europaeiscabiei]MDX3135314.1 NACHT domain-containing protein [Streptomyces europaeiscabiei]